MNDLNNDVVDIDVSTLSNKFILRGHRIKRDITIEGKPPIEVYKEYDDARVAKFEFDVISMVAIGLTLSAIINNNEVVYQTFENTEYIKKMIEEEKKKRRLGEKKQ